MLKASSHASGISRPKKKREAACTGGDEEIVINAHNEWASQVSDRRSDAASSHDAAPEDKENKSCCPSEWDVQRAHHPHEPTRVETICVRRVHRPHELHHLTCISVSR